MKRDAQATRQRIFEAATTEFAQHGIAGARIDRIAAASGSNKAMIYAYYSSKDGLFDAVGVEWISRYMNEVPINAHDLPEYAARLFDQYQKYPEMLRLITWAQLERGPEASRISAVTHSYETKLRAIQEAQQAKAVTDQFPADALLELILAMVQTRASLTSADGPDELKQRRQAIKDAVQRLVRPA